ncbi:MAG: hypothetical protein WDN69_05495 [Aliidongia sp.]
MRPGALAGLAFLLLAGCGTHAVDYPLAAGQANTDRRTVDAEADRPLVVLAFSGGGSRAASVGRSRHSTPGQHHLSTPSGPRRLSQDIAIVSSVSGGSVYAADLGLNGASGTAARAFEQRIGAFDGIGGYLVPRALDPFTWIGLQLDNKTRIGRVAGHDRRSAAGEDPDAWRCSTRPASRSSC